MEEVLDISSNGRISEIVQRERLRLLNFIRKRVDDDGEAEDILQDVFYELTEAYRLMKPIEQMAGWLYRVARNRIIDRFRKRKTSEPNPISLADLLPSPDAGPDALYARSVLLEEIEAALDELPDEQRYVFVAQEMEGRSFRELAEETGLSINTLLSRKRYAVSHLRRRLQAIYDDFTGV